MCSLPSKEKRDLKVELRQPVLARNEQAAARNRDLLRQYGVLAMNMMSSPGAGKTTLLERWLAASRVELAVAVIQGDVATTLDAERIVACGVPAVQINTHGLCHLDADMVGQALAAFDLAKLDCVVIENVGNLVCPAAFDLGETVRVTLLSTAEGDDKPDKYPASFREADAIVLTKTDLLPHVPFDRERFRRAVTSLNDVAPIWEVSALTGEGMARWTAWVRQQCRAVSSAPPTAGP